MPQFSPAVVVLIAIGFVIVINGVMIVSARRGGLTREIEMWRRAAGVVRNPWAKQQQELNELRARVAELETENKRDDEQAN